MTVEDLGDYYVAAGVLNVQEYILQPEPDACMAIRPYGAAPAEYDYGQESPARDSPRVQIVVRGAPNDPQEPAQRAHAIWLLSSKQGVTINGVLYHWLRPLQSEFLLMKDGNDRYIYAFNLEAYRNV